MFQATVESVRRQVERRAEVRVLELTQRVRSQLPVEIQVEAVKGGMRLTGENLRRRFALEPALRWMRLK